MEEKITLYQQILSDIEEIGNSKSKNDCAKLKRKIKMFIKEEKEKHDGKIKLARINKITADLLTLRRQGLENEESINEILQIIAEEYNSLGEDEQEIAKEIYKEILGYEGTDCTKMDLDYIRDIIDRKIYRPQNTKTKSNATTNTKITPDIINIMMDIFDSQNPSVIMNIEDYIDIAENAIIPLIDKDNKELKDKKIVTFLKNIAMQYKMQGNYQRAFELCELGSSLEQFKDEDEYNEIVEELESLKLYLSLEKNFRAVKINMQNKTLAEAIRDGLSEHNLIDIEKGGGHIFLKGTRGDNLNDSQSSNANIMLAERKLEALENLLTEIRKEVPNATIKEIKVNDNGTFDGYIIIPIHGTNITIFESMKEDENAAIYIVDNSQIQSIIGKLTKKDAKNLPGVESVNHTEDTINNNNRFQSYQERLIAKAKSILQYPEKTIQRQRTRSASERWQARTKKAKARTDE